MYPDLEFPIIDVAFLAPEQYQLQFFNWVHYSNTYNGKGSPYDGWSIQLLLYQHTPVYAFGKRYFMGAGAGTHASGDKRFDTLASVAHNYQRIVKFVHDHHDRPPPAQPSFFERLRRRSLVTVEEELTVMIFPKEFELLMEHPQYLDFLEQSRNIGYEIELVPIPNQTDRYRVNISGTRSEAA